MLSDVSLRVAPHTSVVVSNGPNGVLKSPIASQSTLLRVVVQPVLTFHCLAPPHTSNTSHGIKSQRAVKVTVRGHSKWIDPGAHM